MSKIDISKLNEGDVVYYRKGDEYKTGEFVKHTGDILDLKVILVKAIGFPVYDEIVDAFLITEDDYRKKKVTLPQVDFSQKSKVAAKTKAPKAVKAPKENKIKTKILINGNVSVKPTLKGLINIAAENGHTIYRTTKWCYFCIEDGDKKHTFTFKGEVKELFALYQDKGAEALFKLESFTVGAS